MHGSNAVMAQPNAVLLIKRRRCLPGRISRDAIAMHRNNKKVSPAVCARTDPFLVDRGRRGVPNPWVGVEASEMVGEGCVRNLHEWFDIRGSGETQCETLRQLLGIPI